MFSGRPSVRPLKPISRAAISLTGRISIKLVTNIHHASGIAENGSEVKGQGHSELKFTFLAEGYHRLTAVRPLSERRRHTFRRCSVEAYLFAFVFVFD